LKVPNAALRYKPDLNPDEVRDLYAKAGIAAPQRGDQSGRFSSAGQQHPTQAGSDQAQRKEGHAASDVAVIWKVLPNNKLEPVQIQTGITDHTTTQLVKILNGQLNEGDQLITGASRGSGNRGGSNPLGGPPRR
jgi:hypothetical protein